MNNTQELIKSLIGSSKPEAIGTILREGLDFRIAEEDDWVSEYNDKNDNTVSLSIKNRKITKASI